MTDVDPSLHVALAKDGRSQRFNIDRRQDGSWAVVETGDSTLIAVLEHASAARMMREQFDEQIRALLEDGWTPE
jgi:hypothetical protein